MVRVDFDLKNRGKKGYLLARNWRGNCGCQAQCFGIGDCWWCYVTNMVVLIIDRLLMESSKRTQRGCHIFFLFLFNFFFFSPYFISKNLSLFFFTPYFFLSILQYKSFSLPLFPLDVLLLPMVARCFFFFFCTPLSLKILLFIVRFFFSFPQLHKEQATKFHFTVKYFYFFQKDICKRKIFKNRKMSV